MSSDDAIRQELERLRSENEALKKEREMATKYSVKEGDYRGHPVLSVSGPGLAMGYTVWLGKLRAIEACWQQVKAFLASSVRLTHGLLVRTPCPARAYAQ